MLPYIGKWFGWQENNRDKAPIPFPHFTEAVMIENRGSVLIVDDSAAKCNLIKKILEPEGYRVIEAKNEIEALARAVSEDPPDLIAMDIDTPKMDGVALCRRIRSELHLDAPPVIFLTATADQTQLLRVFNAGATDYLVKPFLREELLARLRVHIDKSMLIQKLHKKAAQLEGVEMERVQNQKLQGVVEMAGAVCHELNQPIQTISGFTELMMMKADDENPLTAYARKIKKQVDRIGTITGKLMRVTAYRTKPHDATTQIIDIDEAAKISDG